MKKPIAFAATITAGVCALACALTAAPSVAEPDPPGAATTPLELAPPDPVLVAQDQVSSIASPLANLEDEEGFGRVSLDYDTREVLVQWRGTPPPEVRAAVGLHEHGVRVILKQVKYSQADLGTRESQLLRHGERDDGIPLEVVYPSENMDGVVAMVNNSELDAAATELAPSKRRLSRAETKKRVAHQLDEIVDVPVEVTDTEAAAELSRTNDAAPWQGGGQLRFPNGEFCTAGFSVLTASGQGRILTAGHCDPSAKLRVNDGAGSLIANAGTSQYAPAYDSLLVDPAASPATVGKVFGGAWNAGTSASRYQLHVGGADAPTKDEVVCISGANSGEHCNRTIVATGAKRTINGTVVQGFVFSGPGITAVGGDSGAPVYKMRPDGRAGARGILASGEDGHFMACPSNTAVSPKGMCFDWAFAVGIHRLQDRWNVKVEFD